MLLFATLATVAVAAPSNARMLQGSASSDGGDSIAVDDFLWTVRVEYDIITEGGCLGATSNFASATKGCNASDETLAYCEVQYGSVVDSVVDVPLTYYNGSCSSNPSATIDGAMRRHGSIIFLGFYLDNNCETLGHANDYLLDDACHTSGRHDASGDWVGVSTKVTYDVDAGIASVLQYNSTDCSGVADVMALNDKLLRDGACVDRVQVQTNMFLDGADGSNGGSSLGGAAVAGVTLVTAAFALLMQ